MMLLMFIDALTPHEPVASTDPKSEHGEAHLGTSAAEVDAHARVHGDGTNCPVCKLQVSSPRGPLPNPVAAVVSAFTGVFQLN